MTKDIIEQNYDYIINKLKNDYPGLDKQFRYFELPGFPSGKVTSCIELLDKWHKQDIISLFAFFTGSVINVPINKAVDIIVNKFMIILAWDELVNKLVGGWGTGSSSMLFDFGPNEKVRLHDVSIGETGTRLVLLFCDPLTQQDKVKVALHMLTSAVDSVASWKDMEINILVTNMVATALAEIGAITLGSFRFTYLADLINKVYR